VVNARYRLVWPESLFVWEARRVADLHDDILFSSVVHLLSEAFQDPAVVEAFTAETGAHRGSFAPASDYDSARAWLRGLSGDTARLIPYSPPQYYAERKGLVSTSERPFEVLGEQFGILLRDMQDNGYFPIALPRECEDDWVEWDQVSQRVSRAIHMPFTWAGNPTEVGSWGQALLLSVVEFFHDQAQRPRRPAYFHEHNDCGWHYTEHSAEAGAAVYRWRVNQLLDRHGTGLNLGRSGDERGRLVQRFGSPLDNEADARAAEGAEDSQDEVAHAIRTFRERGASSTQKRTALALLAGALEPRRPRLRELLGKDEADLFNIANNFGIRHRNDRQRMGYGDEFLDYLFGVFLSSVRLMESVEKRPKSQEPSVEAKPAGK